MRKTEIFVYPNPVFSDLHIKTNATIKNVEIFDMTGKNVYQSLKKDLEVDFLGKGLYILKVTTSDNKIEMKKIVKK